MAPIRDARDRESRRPLTDHDLDRLLQAPDLEAACHAVFDKAHTKWRDRGESALTPSERALIAVETFFGEVCNGGFLQYLGNESGAFAQDLPESLVRVGLMQYVPLALELRELFPGGVPRDDASRWRMTEQLPDTGTRLEDLTRRFLELHAHEGSDEFRRKLFALIRDNRSEFAAAPGSGQ